MSNEHRHTLGEMKAKRDRLWHEVRDVPGVQSIGLGANDSLVVLVKHADSQNRLPEEFEGCKVTSKVVGEVVAY